MHDLSLVETIAAAFTAAWLLGLLTQRLGLSPIVGYLLAGVVIGPHSPGFVADRSIAPQLAEVGVILLMFGVGLHFHVNDLLAVKWVAIPGAIGQVLVATVLGAVVFSFLGAPLNTATVMGMALSVASTVVLMRVLMDAGALDTQRGHVAVGWLLVEDVITVIVLVLIPTLGTATGVQDASAQKDPLWLTLGVALLKLVMLVAILLVAGVRMLPWVLVRVTKFRSRELFTLTVLVFSIAIAAGSYFIFGASMALGAFLAGMVVAQSPVSHQAAADALPLRDAFAVLFFVSVGMLFDPSFLIHEPLLILAALAIILIAKPLAALAIIATLGYSVQLSLTVAIGLAQIGEFSFIFAEVARQHGLMSEEGHSALVAAAIITITLNPMLFRAAPGIERWLQRHPSLWAILNGKAERRLRETNASAGQAIAKLDQGGPKPAIVVGYGPVGRAVDQLLREAGLPTVIIDLNMDTVAQLTAAGRAAIFGDASREAILEQAGVRQASHLLLTLPHSSDRTAVVTAAKNMNPSLRILVRARYLAERQQLEEAGATAAVFEEGEASIALARLTLASTGLSREHVERSIRDLRMRLILENVSNLASQSVRNVMIPWTRVHRLSSRASHQDVLREISRQHFSRWPVVDSATDVPIGYLLAKDLVAEALANSDWTRLVRPVHSVSPSTSIEAALLELQRENATVCIVVEAGRPVGLITVEDILEQVVGRIEDEYPREPSVGLREAFIDTGNVLDLQSRDTEHAIREMAAAIPSGRVPPGADIARMAVEREREISTDVGFGIAIPHARCPGLRRPLIVLGRSREGIVFSERTSEPVRLLFLLVTPAEQPDLQVLLLGRLAVVASDPAVRARLLTAETFTQVIETLSQCEHIGTPQAAPASGAKVGV